MCYLMFTRHILRVLSRSQLPNCASKRFHSTAPHIIQRSNGSTWQPFAEDSPLKELTFSRSYDAQQIVMDIERKRKFGSDKPATSKIRKPGNPRKARKVNAFFPEGSNEEVLEIEVSELLREASTSNGPNEHAESNDTTNAPSQASKFTEAQRPAELGEEVELEIVELSSTGDGLAYNEAKDHIFIVPFSVPGDRVLAKPWRWEGPHTLADFIKVVRPSTSREGATPQCGYFAKCSGCQFQMLPYEKQLDHKRGIVRKAFKHFSGLKEGQVPDVLPTMGSPLQYGYRTKLSPHFDGPKKFGGRRGKFEEVPNIGFNIKGTRKVMDIESCPIGTNILQEGLKIERKRVAETLDTYKNGATILLRESTERKTVDPDAGSSALPSDPTDLQLVSHDLTHGHNGKPTLTLTYPAHTDTKTYISDEKAYATEYITTTTDSTTNPPQTKTYKFTNTAGSFFQNNNSILGSFTSYISEQCKPKTNPSDNNIKYLLDAYSGSGLFTLTLSSHFTSSLGIDIDSRSIAAARENAAANSVSNAGFIDADASALFADVPYPADQTCVVVDPPRKGCDREFLKQLRRFGAQRVIYVSCNVHSQARDVGILVNGFRRDEKKGYSGDLDAEVDGEWEEDGLWKYEIESLRGFDFFPQTGHVEGVCVLRRVG